MTAMEVQGQPETTRGIGVFRTLVRALLSAPVWCVLLGVVVWLVFQPGNIDGDGIAAYRSAINDVYCDWHPPIIPLLLNATLKWGFGHSVFVLIQCVTGCLGLYYLARANILFWFGESLSVRRASRAAFVVFLFLLLVPLSPVMFYFAHFGKDTWAIVSVLWIGVAGLNLFRGDSTRFSLHTAGNVALLVASVTMFLLVRFNALLLLPIFAVLAFVLLKPWGWRIAAATAVLVAASPLLADFGMRQRFPIHRSHAEDQVMSTELVGMCVLDESVCAELPFTDSHLVKERYRQEYQWGEAGPMFVWWGGPGPIVKPGFSANNHEELAPEYWRAAKSHPWLLAKVKMKAFKASLLDDYPSEHHRGIDPNEFGFALNTQYARPRATLLHIDDWINKDKFLRRVARRHVAWLGVTLAAVAYLGVWGAFRRDRKQLVAALFLLIPLGYYATYLLATASHNFRYMYPATLFVQVLTVALATGWGFRARLLQKRLAVHESAVRREPETSRAAA